MQIDLATHIEKLLFLHDSLSIPSFGGFTVTRAAASPDYVGGSVYPPTKTLTFNENLTNDDGRLIEDVATTHHLGLEDARRVVQEFVEKMQERLDQREIVTLPGIGRLYKNYVQKIQFLPDTTNFDPEAYGLPPLQFSPIARSRAVEETNSGNSSGIGSEIAAPPASAIPAAAPVPAPVPSAAPVTAPATASGSGASRVLGFFAVLLLLLAVALGVWWIRRPKTDETAGDTKTEQPATSGAANSGKPSDRPAKNTDETETPAPATAPRPAPQRATPSAPAARPAPTETQPSTARTAEGKLCILVIATLREQNNADRLVNLLKTNGYTVYLQEKTGFQVGIQFRYRDVREIQDKIVELQRLTGEEDIWIKKK